MHASTKLLSHSDDAHCWRYCATAFGQGRKDLSIDQRSGAFKMLQMGKYLAPTVRLWDPNLARLESGKWLSGEVDRLLDNRNCRLNMIQ